MTNTRLISLKSALAMIHQPSSHGTRTHGTPEARAFQSPRAPRRAHHPVTLTSRSYGGACCANSRGGEALGQRPLPRILHPGMGVWYRRRHVHPQLARLHRDGALGAASWRSTTTHHLRLTLSSFTQGVQKERMQASDMFVVDAEAGTVVEAPCGGHKLSECAPLFMAAFQLRGAGAVLHSHAHEALLATLLDEEATEFRGAALAGAAFWLH